MGALIEANFGGCPIPVPTCPICQTEGRGSGGGSFELEANFGGCPIPVPTYPTCETKRRVGLARLVDWTVCLST